MAVTSPEVRVGQIWADNDPRSAGRTVEVIEVGLTKTRWRNVASWRERRHGTTKTEEPAVRVRTVTPARNVGKVGQTTVVLLSRFRPIATGYVLVEDVTS